MRGDIEKFTIGVVAEFVVEADFIVMLVICLLNATYGHNNVFLRLVIVYQLVVTTMHCSGLYCL